MANPHNTSARSLAHSLAPDSTSKLTIFVSYVHEDLEIATALNNTIVDAFGNDVAVFIDKVRIQQGDNVRTSINENLQKADILAVVSTGVDGPRYWAGYEIGYFGGVHQGQAPPNHPLWGTVVNFCSGKPPDPVDAYKYLPLGFDDSELEKTPEEFSKQLAIGEDEPLLLWFGELFAITTGDQLVAKKARQDNFKQIIKGFWKEVFAAFKERPKSEVKPQKQLKIRFSLVPERQFQIKDDAEITLLGNAQSVFGIPNQSIQQLSWKLFCAELIKTEGSLAPFWIATLSRILARAGRYEVNGNVIWSHNEQRLFQLFLTTYTTYHNGTVEASLYIVEMLRRQDQGDAETTLLAKGLQSALRFRSLFLEKDGLFNYLNVKFPTDPLSRVAADIVAELDILNSDLLDANIASPSKYRGILELSEIENMAGTWIPLRGRLLEDCKQAIDADAPKEIEVARLGLAATLQQIESSVGPLNEEFLRAIAKRLITIADEAKTKRDT